MLPLPSQSNSLRRAPSTDGYSRLPFQIIACDKRVSILCDLAKFVEPSLHQYLLQLCADVDALIPCKLLIEEFHANKGMILLFDAGPQMRKELYRRYGSINLKHIENKNDLLLL